MYFASLLKMSLFELNKPKNEKPVPNFPILKFCYRREKVTLKNHFETRPFHAKFEENR